MATGAWLPAGAPTGRGISQVQKRRKNKIVSAVTTVVLVAAGFAGIASVGGGISDHDTASALNDPDSDFVSVVGTVTRPPAAAQASRKELRQMSVRYTTADDQRVKTMVWTRRGNNDYDAGQRIDLEYVAQHPSAARLPGDQAGRPEPWRQLVLGIGILAALVLVPVGLLFEAVSGRRRRRRAKA